MHALYSVSQSNRNKFISDNNSMHFKKYLEKNKYEPYSDKYLKYNYLVDLISPNITDEQEKTFKDALDEDINNVFGFIQFKHEEIESKMASIEEMIKDGRGHRELSRLLDEMYAFAEFIRVNIQGFKAILAKHDKKTSYELISEYKRIFRRKMNEIDCLNKLIYSASRLKLKTLEIKREKESGTTFVRKTCKYWVHPENLYPLKLKIVKNLPVYVFNSTPDPNATPYSCWDHRLHDTCVSSVYLDNEDFEMYTGRLYKNQGAEAIRIRWYGSTVPNVVFVERKRHEDKWTGYSSKKLRFKIPEKYVVDYLNGKNVWEHVKTLNGNDSFELYKEVQTAIISKRLRPAVRTFYKRTAFQLPNDSSVRISLDTNLVMIREWIDSDSSNEIKQWRRPDAVCEWPFKKLPKKDVVRFPYGILEVKTQGVDETKPDWIEEIIQSSYVEHVHKYSKFMHGCAILFKKIETIPYWLPQMGTDIRKDPFHSIKDYKVIDNNTLKTVSGERENSSENQSPVEDHGKRIAMPVRVEPKVFFANERTFLKWVQFSIFLGGIGTALLGLGDSDAAWCGTLLMTVAILFIFYALYIYKWRMEKIRIRYPGPYDDLVGPSILVAVFLTSIFLSIVFRFPSIIQDHSME